METEIKKTKRVSQTKEEKRLSKYQSNHRPEEEERRRQYQKKKYAEMKELDLIAKIQCDCGGLYLNKEWNKQLHELTKRHQKYFVEN